jgi:hypothetical protein
MTDHDSTEEAARIEREAEKTRAKLQRDLEELQRRRREAGEKVRQCGRTAAMGTLGVTLLGVALILVRHFAQGRSSPKWVGPIRRFLRDWGSG